MADYFTFNWGSWKSKQNFLMVKPQTLTSVAGKIFREEGFLTLPPKPSLLLGGKEWAQQEARDLLVCGDLDWALDRPNIYHLILTVRSAFSCTFHKRGLEKGRDQVTFLKRLQWRHILKSGLPDSKAFTSTSRPVCILLFYPDLFVLNIQFLALKNSFTWFSSDGSPAPLSITT